MIDQLQLLEQTIVELKARYNVTATELANLKNKLSQDDTPQKLSETQAKLEQLQISHNHLNAEFGELIKEKEDLTAQLEELYRQNQELIKQNNALNEKNALAISRAEIIQEWLTKIDNQTT